MRGAIVHHCSQLPPRNRGQYRPKRGGSIRWAGDRTRLQPQSDGPACTRTLLDNLGGTIPPQPTRPTNLCLPPARPFRRVIACALCPYRSLCMSTPPCVRKWRRITPIYPIPWAGAIQTLVSIIIRYLPDRAGSAGMKARASGFQLPPIVHEAN